MKIIIAIIAALCVIESTSAFTHDIVFRGVPQPYFPSVEGSVVGARGSCASEFEVRSKFLVQFPKPTSCDHVAFANPRVVSSKAFRNNKITVETLEYECGDVLCSQYLKISIHGLACPEGAMDETMHGVINVGAEFDNPCHTEQNKQVGMGIKYDFTFNELVASAADRSGKRSAANKKREIRSCSVDGDCAAAFSCAQGSGSCQNGVCVVVNQTVANAFCQNATAYGIQGTCINVTAIICDPEAEQYALATYGASQGFSTIGCYAPPAAYTAIGTACNNTDEPGPYYNTNTTGVCQGTGEGYCVPNNQDQFIGDTDTSPSSSSSKNDDLFNADSSDVGQFNEGDFPLRIGTSADAGDANAKQRGLPLEWEDLITEPWVHSDDEDVIDPATPLFLTYPVDERLVDDDANNDAAYWALFVSNSTMFSHCHVPLLLGPDGGGLGYCNTPGAALQVNTTTRPTLAGRFHRPSGEDFTYDDDGKEDDGGDQSNVLLKNVNTFCSPMCYCVNITYNGVHKRQIAFCHQDFFPVAGDSGTKQTRTNSIITWAIWGGVLALCLFMYAGLAWSAALFRTNAMNFISSASISVR